MSTAQIIAERIRQEEPRLATIATINVEGGETLDVYV
jgi:hypothetical protein